jgi:hypothetical protein
MQLIQTVTVGSGGEASITFGSIPADYTDLYIVFSGRSNRSNSFDNIRVMPNGLATDVSSRILYGSGSSASSFTESFVSGYTNANSSTSSTFGNSAIYIPNYRSSTAKSFSIDSVSENNATAASQAITAGLWNNTGVITSIVLDQGDGSTWLEHTSASLYGIKSGSDGIVTVS